MEVLCLIRKTTRLATARLTAARLAMAALIRSCLAHRRPRSEGYAAASLLLILGLMRHEAWPLMPPHIQALVWNVCGALVLAAFLAWTAWRFRRSFPVLLVIGWWAWEELLVAGCSSWRILQFWEVLPGHGQCSARIGFPFGALSVCIVAAIAAALSKRGCRETDA